MKAKLIFAVLAAVLSIAAGTMFADPGKGKGRGNEHNSHPGEKNNGIGSSRFPNHYAGPSHPKHP